MDFVVRRGGYKIPKKVSGLPLHENVEILEDRYGIPHIFAANEHDLAVAFGFVQANDRLWQMELIRRLATGRLSEILGPDLIEVDHWVRLAGFPRMCACALRNLEADTREYYLGFAKGVNAYISYAGRKLPLEYRSQKIRPEPWVLEDLSAAIAFNAWALQASYKQKILAVVACANLTESLWLELFPPYYPVQNPPRNFFSTYGGLKFGKLIGPAMGMDPDLVESISGSNNWVTMNDAVAAPLLANDPHLGVAVPPVWYFAHLSCPTLNVAGVFVPGNPSIIAGRNAHVAWGLTNVMTDCTDLVAFRVDPSKPTHYYVAGRTQKMAKRTEKIPVADETPREVTIYETVHGPVITELAEGVEAAVALKWYGTAKDDVIADFTAKGFSGLARAQTALEADASVKHIGLLGNNFVFGDSGGSIGWRASGLVPIRDEYAGNLPADGSSGAGEWLGFIPNDEMPALSNPSKGHIVTANSNVTHDTYPHYITETWCAPYRYERICELLEETEEHSVETFRKLQLDTKSKQAERLVPGILAFSYTHADAELAARILSQWDYALTAESAAAAIYEVFLNKFSEVLLEERLGPGISMFIFLRGFLFSCVDVLLAANADSRRDATSGLLDGRDLKDVCEEALVKTVAVIRNLCGDDDKKWTWGSIHRYWFRHPGADGRLSSWLLNRGPYPHGGDGATVNAAVPNSGKRTNNRDQYEITTIQSMRFVTRLDNIEETYIVGPMGQSGRPGTPHYGDMLKPYLDGELIQIPLSRSGAEKIAKSMSELTPGS